jgi:hypothetical protein
VRLRGGTAEGVMREKEWEQLIQWQGKVLPKIERVKVRLNQKWADAHLVGCIRVCREYKGYKRLRMRKENSVQRPPSVEV